MPRVNLVTLRLTGLVLACFAITSPAFADDDDRVRAEARWKQGKAFYDAGQWDSAIAEFQAVWEVTKEPDLVFGIGLAFHKKGDARSALDYFKRYLALAPAGDAANEARDLVVVLTPKVEALDAEAAGDAKRKADEAEAKRKADEQARAERDQREQAAASSRRRAGILRWTGISMAVAGGAVIGIGAKFGSDARTIADELSAHTSGAWTEAELDRQADGRSANRKMIALTSIGGALVVGGAVTFVLSLRAPRERTPVAFAIDPMNRGFAVSGRF